MDPVTGEYDAFLRWLRKPRSPRDIMQRKRPDGSRYGYPFVQFLPPNVVVALGTDENGIRRTYYWLPNYTDSQAKALAQREIDTFKAQPIRPEAE